MVNTRKPMKPRRALLGCILSVALVVVVCGVCVVSLSVMDVFNPTPVYLGDRNTVLPASAYEILVCDVFRKGRTQAEVEADLTRMGGFCRGCGGIMAVPDELVRRFTYATPEYLLDAGTKQVRGFTVQYSAANTVEEVWAKEWTDWGNVTFSATCSRR
jgi:hypothetical protein